MLIELEIFPGGFGPPTRKIFIESDKIVLVAPYRSSDCEVTLQGGTRYMVNGSVQSIAAIVNSGKSKRCDDGSKTGNE